MKKKVILITGTSSGFGRLHVQTLSEAGHMVYATLRNIKGRNAAAVAELEILPNVRVLELDVTDTATIKAAVESIIAAEGRLDVLINNAGYGSFGLAETYSEGDVEQMFDVHVKGTWRTIKEALPHMRRQGEGLIINTTSTLGRFSSPFLTIYNAAKFAVEGISEGLHYEVRPLGIDVAILQPGAFPTELGAKASIGSDVALAADYGALAEVPNQIGTGLAQLFETTKPNPQVVADAVKRLVDLPKGQRPLRTVADPQNGALVELANKHVAEGYKHFVSGLGLKDLLN